MSYAIGPNYRRRISDESELQPGELFLDVEPDMEWTNVVIDYENGIAREKTAREYFVSENRARWASQAAQRAQIQARKVLNAPLSDNPSKTDIEARINALRTLQGI